MLRKVVRGVLLQGDRVEAQVIPHFRSKLVAEEATARQSQLGYPGLEVFDFEVDTSRVGFQIPFLARLPAPAVVLQDRSAERCVDNGGQDCLQRQHDP
jgi:hypothetical protein